MQFSVLYQWQAAVQQAAVQQRLAAASTGQMSQPQLLACMTTSSMISIDYC